MVARTGRQAAVREGEPVFGREGSAIERPRPPPDHRDELADRRREA